MGKYRVLAFLGTVILGGAILVLSQEQDPLVHRATSVKVLSGEGRLRSGFLKVRLRQQDWVENPDEMSVTVTMVDSSTATNPDSLRFFTTKQFRKDGFIIRSPRFPTDTVKVRWVAVGR